MRSLTGVMKTAPTAALGTLVGLEPLHMTDAAKV